MNDSADGFDHPHGRVGLENIPPHVDANGAASDGIVR